VSTKRKTPKGLTDEEFAGLRLAVLDEMTTGRTRAPVAKPAKLKAAKRPKAKAKERVRMVTRPLVAETVTPPMGTLQAAPDAEPPKPWELDPAALRVAMDKALWPTDDSNHTWVLRPPMSLTDFLKSGI
jgi:hypothetical protein